MSVAQPKQYEYAIEIHKTFSDKLRDFEKELKMVEDGDPENYNILTS